MKKIVLLTASPRANGNSAAMARAFSRTVQEQGAELVRIDAALCGVKGCIACDNCFKNGRPCCFDDGFNQILEEILSADAIAFEKACKANGKPGRMIPVPREISAGCGLAWATVPTERDGMEEFLVEQKIAYEEMTELLH